MKKMTLLLQLSLLAACSSSTEPAAPLTLTLHDVGIDRAHVVGAAYGAGCFVIVGSGGIGARSCDDGGTWERVELGVGVANLREVTYTNGRFIAVGQHRAITQSTDGGRTWSGSMIPGGEYLRDVAFGNGAWVVVGDEGVMLRSTDLRRWESVAIDHRTRWASATFSRGQFVISGIWESFALSSDARSWERRDMGWNAQLDCPYGYPTPTCNDMDEIREGCGRYFTVIHPTMSVWESTDLVRWERLTLELPETGGGLWGVRTSGELIAVAGHAGKLALSSDCGRTWSPIQTSGEGLAAVAFSPTTLLVAGMNGTVGTVRLR